MNNSLLDNCKRIIEELNSEIVSKDDSCSDLQVSGNNKKKINNKKKMSVNKRLRTVQSPKSIKPRFVKDSNASSLPGLINNNDELSRLLLACKSELEILQTKNDTLETINKNLARRVNDASKVFQKNEILQKEVKSLQSENKRLNKILKGFEQTIRDESVKSKKSAQSRRKNSCMSVNGSRINPDMTTGSIKSSVTTKTSDVQSRAKREGKSDQLLNTLDALLFKLETNK